MTRRATTSVLSGLALAGSTWAVVTPFGLGVQMGVLVVLVWVCPVALTAMLRRGDRLAGFGAVYGTLAIGWQFSNPIEPADDGLYMFPVLMFPPFLAAIALALTSMGFELGKAFVARRAP